MKKILVLAILFCTTAMADAGPIRNWIQSRQQQRYASPSCTSGARAASCQSCVTVATVRGCPAGVCVGCNCVDEAKCGTTDGACHLPKPYPLPSASPTAPACTWEIINGKMVQVCPKKVSAAIPEMSPDKIFAIETDTELRTALLADLDRLINQRSWLVGEDQKRRARAVRAVVESDMDVVHKIKAKLP